VGSVARLTTNFSVTDVVLVAPQCNWNDDQAQQYACRLGQDALASFRVVATLAEALVDVEVAIAFTRRTGDWRRPDLELSDAPLLCGEKKVALVFGREDNGLTRDEVLQCTQVCSIPSSEFNPSLNLSHAVAVVLAQWFAMRAMSGSDASIVVENAVEVPCPSAEETLASLGQFEAMMSDLRQTMVDVGLNRAGNPERLLPHFQRMFQRAALTSKEADILRGFLAHVQKAVGTKPGRGS
jgi:tRNA/rRNA methyltransferase